MHEFFGLPGASSVSVFDMPSESPATLKSQPANTLEGKKKKKIIPESSHANSGRFHLRHYFGKAAKREYFLPNAHQTQMQQI